MNNRSLFKLFLVWLASGLAIGFISLVLASVLDLFFPQGKLSTIYLFVLLEEMLKLGTLVALFSYGLFSPQSSILETILGGLGIGLGFSIFELSLIFLSFSEIPIAAIYPIFVHLATSCILAWSVRNMFSTGAKLSSPFLIGFAVIIHLCYNIYVVVSM